MSYLVALTMIVAAVALFSGRWAILRSQGNRGETAATHLPLGSSAAVLVATIMAFGLLPLARGSQPSEMPSTTSHGSVLRRNLIIPLTIVKNVLPEMSREIATGRDETAVGKPTGTRSVTYATADGSQRLVVSIDHYPTAEDASTAYQRAFQMSQKVPGAKGELVSNLGQRAFIGVATQGKETHVGGGALYRDMIVSATLQGYEGTQENKAKVTAIILKQAARRKPSANGKRTPLLFQCLGRFHALVLQ
jgi:hypothetical protein